MQTNICSTIFSVGYDMKHLPNLISSFWRSGKQSFMHTVQMECKAKFVNLGNEHKSLIAMSTGACYLYLCCVRWIQFMAFHHISVRSYQPPIYHNSSYVDYRENRVWLKVTNIIKAINFLRYTCANRFGPRVVTWTWLLKNWKWTIRLKNKT